MHRQAQRLASHTQPPTIDNYQAVLHTCGQASNTVAAVQTTFNEQHMYSHTNVSDNTYG